MTLPKCGICGHIYIWQENIGNHANNIAKEDAKLFSIINKAVGLTHLKIVTGDLGVLRSAINGLEINSRCKKALLRQL